jgi:hypothetical protein
MAWARGPRLTPGEAGKAVSRSYLVAPSPLKAAGAKQRVAEQPDDLGRVDPKAGLAPQLLADRLSDRIRDRHLGQGRWRGGPPSLPELIDLALLERLATQVEELVDLVGGRLIAEQVDLKGEVDDNGQAAGDVVDLPDRSVGQDDPLDPFVDRVHLDLAQVTGRELGRDPFDLDEGDQLAIDAQPVVGELALDLVLGGQVGVLVEAQAVAEEVGDQQAGVAFVGVAGDQVGQRLAVPADGALEAIAGLGLPLGVPRVFDFLAASATVAAASPSMTVAASSSSMSPPSQVHKVRDLLARDEPCPTLRILPARTW